MKPRVLVSTSDDGGKRWSWPRTVSDADPLGRAGVAILGDGSVLVCWIEALGDDRGAEVRVRWFPREGPPAPPATVSNVSAGRRSGVPVLARTDRGALIAWCGKGRDATRVLVAEVRVR